MYIEQFVVRLSVYPKLFNPISLGSMLLRYRCMEVSTLSLQK